MDSQLPTVIKLDNVTKVYQVERQPVEALRGVSLDIKKGEMIAVVGRSGSGKSTLLHVTGTLDRPSSGTIFLNGKNISDFSDNTMSTFRNRTVGFVFQMNNLLPEFSALENVMMPGLIAGIPKAQLKESASSLLDAVKLNHRVNHRPAELSGGEQQRVAIARALIMEPPVLLADEPTGNLDVKSSEAVEELLFKLCEMRKVTMLLVTHDLALAKRLPARIAMEDGKVVEGGGTQ